MGEISDAARSHPLFAELSKCLELISLALPQTAGNTPAFDLLERIQRATELINRVINQSDASLLPPPMLENIRTHMKAMRGELQAFGGNKDPKHLAEANNRINGILPSVFGLPIPYKQTGLEQIGDEISDHRRRLDQHAASLSERLAALADELKRIREGSNAAAKEIGQQKARLDTAISDFQKQFSDSQAAQQSEFAAAERVRAGGHIEAMKQIIDSYNAASNERQASFDKWINDLVQKSGSILKQLDSDSKAEMERISKLRADAEKIVGLIGEHGMVHGYQTQANSARTSFRFWSGTAVLALLLWILFGLVAFGFTYAQPIEWSTVARQFLVSTPFLLLATFSGYQAFVQQRTTSRLRGRELEIASLDPFLASLSREESNEVKKRMVEKFFGHTDADNTPAPPDLAATAMGIIDRLSANLPKK